MSVILFSRLLQREGVLNDEQKCQVLELVRKLDVRTGMVEEGVDRLTAGISALERCVAGVKVEIAGLYAGIDRVNRSLDRIGRRLDRIEDVGWKVP